MFINKAVLERGRKKNALLVFLHCQRTGGSNFSRWINTRFENEEIYSRRTSDPYTHWHSLEDLSVLDDALLVSGFSYYKEHPVDRPIVFLSNVRHPFYRVVSLFQMSRENKNHFMHDISKDGSFEDFYRIGTERRDYYFNNLMSKRIGGQASFEIAKAKMEKNFAIVGTTYNLDLMTAKLCEALDWDLEPIEPNGKKPDEEQYESYRSSPVYEEVLERNAQDLKLFEYVNFLAPKGGRKVRRKSTVKKTKTAASAVKSQSGKTRSKVERGKKSAEEIREQFTRQDRIFEKQREADPDVHFGEYYAAQALERVREGHDHATLGTNLRNQGGWKDAGRNAFERYLKTYQFKPKHKVVDYGCGSLRIGNHFIDYLNSGNYFGLDIISGFYEIGVDMLGEEVRAKKKPRFGEIHDPTALKKAAVMKPDFVYSSAVAYHVHPDDAPEYYANLMKLAHKPGATLFFDVTLSAEHFRYRQRSWTWPLEFYVEQLKGFTLTDVHRSKDREEMGKIFTVARLTFVNSK